MRTLLPQRTMGMFSHTRTRSRCQMGTFLYVTRAVTSNMMMAHCKHKPGKVGMVREAAGGSNLAVDVVTVAQAAKLLLAGSIPDVKHNRAVVCVEGQGVHVDTERGCKRRAKA